MNAIESALRDLDDGELSAFTRAAALQRDSLAAASRDRWAAVWQALALVGADIRQARQAEARTLAELDYLPGLDVIRVEKPGEDE